MSNTGTFDSSTKSKLESAYSSYYSVYTSSNLGTLNTRPRFNLDHNEQVNFARTWAFLRVGMGLNSAQTSAVMGNINQESRFASDNANDRLYPGDHNSGYSFRANDGIAYGIVQWQYNSRKQGLLNTANSMGLSVSDINAQFAFLRSEATGSYASAWSNTKNAGDVGSKTITFMRQFEQVNDGTDDKRVENANAIYNLLSGF